MNKYDKLQGSPEIDSAVSEAIIRNARSEPMELAFIGDGGRLSIGNTASGFRYSDSEGHPISREDAEPFRLLGTNIVIGHGRFEVEASEDGSNS